MKVKIRRALGAVVLTTSLCLQPMMARADIVTTDQLTAQHQADADRAKVASFIERADVKQRLQAMGVEGVFAKERVAALDDQEIHALAQKIDSMPAGGALTNYDIIIILLIAILVIVAI